MLPVKADVHKAIGKETGSSVLVRLNARIDRWLSIRREVISSRVF
jgi:hypothetical protein